MWSERLEKIHSINEQLCSNVALNILMNLEDAHSTYANSFNLVKREIAKVRKIHCVSNTKAIRSYLNLHLNAIMWAKSTRDITPT